MKTILLVSALVAISSLVGCAAPAYVEPGDHDTPARTFYLDPALTDLELQSMTIALESWQEDTSLTSRPFQYTLVYGVMDPHDLAKGEVLVTRTPDLSGETQVYQNGSYMIQFPLDVEMSQEQAQRVSFEDVANTIGIYGTDLVVGSTPVYTDWMAQYQAVWK